MSDDEFGDIPDEDMLEVLVGFDSAASATAPVAPPPPNIRPAILQGPLQQKDSTNLLPTDLDDLPSDAFDFSPEPARRTVSETTVDPRPRPRQAGLARTASGTKYRQTTLWGVETTTTEVARPQALQRSTSRTYRADAPAEAPTHHALDHNALQTWVYPTNLGAIRDYQYSIVRAGLFSNTLVALPTGLGKTFIAATVMLNFYRWARDAQIVFVAPTKPLATQQVEACFNIVGIPRSHTTLLTGEVAPALRVDEWKYRRVFFMTPQTLLNDLSAGYANPKNIVLLVVDEAHRAVGEYAYAKVVKFMRRFSSSFRVLALTATPGSSIETVQEVVDNLGIAHVEIRTEESMDIRQYVHSRDIEKHVLAYSDEILQVRVLLTGALQPMVDRLSQQNIYYARDPMNFTAYGLMQAQREWFASQGKKANQGLQHVMRAIFSLLTGVAHSIKLLNLHGIKPFYDNMAEYRREVEAAGDKGSKFKRQLVKDDQFTEMMDQIQTWLRSSSFVGHPKLARLTDTVLNHFMDAGEQSGTRVIVFSEFRDSAEEIVRTLNLHQPMVKATVFVGQADTKRSEGMKQAQQIETIDRFKRGDFNVLVATSIGEEGLDIGQVDLIVCYDASSSPIRMLQRMGRTGRKRAGRIVLLLMQGREEDNYARSKDAYEAMQKLICEGSRFNFRHDLSSRIVPRDVRPEVDKRAIEIPVENTQDPSMPEPRRSGGGGGGVGKNGGRARAEPKKKKPAKKFHMPDGVETGFVTASALAGMPSDKASKTATKTATQMAAAAKAAAAAAAAAAKKKRLLDEEMKEIAEVPSLEMVSLGQQDEYLLDHKYKSFSQRKSRRDFENFSLPDLAAHPQLQRCLRIVGAVPHGQHTKRRVRLLQAMARLQTETWDEGAPSPYDRPDRDTYLDIPVRDFAPDTDDEEGASHHALLLSSSLSSSSLPSTLPSSLSAGHKRHAVAVDPEEGEVEMDEEAADGKDHSHAKRRKVAAAPNTVRRNGRGGASSDSARLLPPAATIDLDEGDDHDLPPVRRVATTMTRTTGQKAPPPPLGKKNTRGGVRGGGVRGGVRGGRAARGRRGNKNINSDEVGDDCMRDSDLVETDGSDDGADLVDFIVSDSHPISSMVDDNLPDISSLLQTPGRAAVDQSSPPVAQFVRRTRQRTFISDDEDDDSG